jgi:tyrosyl-tRNA synthetase
MLRSIDIMGREQGTDIELAKLLYPAMQAADIFYQGVDIVHAGMDQRKAHVIARDTALKIDNKLFSSQKPQKPIALHHHLLQSLNGKDKEDKMSKSDPDSAIFVHDEPEEIERKIKQAFAPEKEVEHNPILNWTDRLLFWNRGDKPFRIERAEKHGGNVEFSSYKALEEAYAGGNVHPMDLKSAVAKELIELLAPVCEHFAKPEIAAKKAELDKILQNR